MATRNCLFPFSPRVVALPIVHEPPPRLGNVCPSCHAWPQGTVCPFFPPCVVALPVIHATPLWSGNVCPTCCNWLPIIATPFCSSACDKVLPTQLQTGIMRPSCLVCPHTVVVGMLVCPRIGITCAHCLSGVPACAPVVPCNVVFLSPSVVSTDRFEAALSSDVAVSIDVMCLQFLSKVQKSVVSCVLVKIPKQGYVGRVWPPMWAASPPNSL